MTQTTNRLGGPSRRFARKRLAPFATTVAWSAALACAVVATAQDAAVSAVSASSSSHRPAQEAATPSETTATNDVVSRFAPLDRAYISFRISGGVWEDERRFADLLDLFDKHPGATDEITFFTEQTHSPPTVEAFEKRLKILKIRMAEAKRRGYRTGLNILCTIGHHPESMKTAIGPEYPRCLTLDGKIAEATLCMNQPIFRERVRRVYAAMARSGADYIWIDDDVRAGHWLDSAGNAGNVCFCDRCMEGISAKLGAPTTREELASRMSDRAVRAKVREFNSDSIDALFALIEETVHAEKPGLPLGFMTGERYAEGYDFARWAKTLAGPENAPVYWRPGGGFYSQDPIGAMTAKSDEIARQVATLPPEVRVIESEIENFPYAPLQKARRIVALEATCHLAAGCSGAAFNVVTMNREPVADYEPLIAELARRRPFFDAVVRAFGRKPLIGAFPTWNPTDFDLPNGNPTPQTVGALAEVGIPLTFEQTDAPLAFSTAAYLETLSRDEALDLLSRGLYLDIWGVCRLNNPETVDLVRYTGIEWEGERAVDSIEVYSDDPINGEFAGIERDQRQSFWRDRAYSLRLSDPAARSLARLVDYTGKTTAASSAAIFENELGGRVSVAGYHPWNYFHSRPKATQVKRLARWLSNDRLCGWVDSFDRARLWVRANETGEPDAALFLNATYDAAERPVLALRTDAESATVLDRNGKKTVVPASEPDGPYRRFELPEVEPWDAVLVVLD